MNTGTSYSFHFNHNLCYCYIYLPIHNFSAIYCRFYIHNVVYIYIYIYINTHHFYSKFITIHSEGILDIFVNFNILFPLTKHKSHITVCVYVKGIGTDLLCKLPDLPYNSNTTTLI